MTGFPLRPIPLGGFGTLGSVQLWMILVAISGMILLYRGRYGLVVIVATLMVSLFTLFTIVNGVAMQFSSDYAVTAEQLVSGFKFEIPQGALVVAFAAFGITGVGASELFYYPYWCVEKGYARFAGPRDDSADWLRRARGWIRVMQVDAWTAFLVYTVATIAFYFLGAAVLHDPSLPIEERGPAESELIRTLSLMYHG